MTIDGVLALLQEALMCIADGKSPKPTIGSSCQGT